MLGNKSPLHKNFFYPTLNIDFILLHPLCYCKVDSFKEKTSDKNLFCSSFDFLLCLEIIHMVLFFGRTLVCTLPNDSKLINNYHR